VKPRSGKPASGPKPTSNPPTGSGGNSKPANNPPIGFDSEKTKQNACQEAPVQNIEPQSQVAGFNPPGDRNSSIWST